MRIRGLTDYFLKSEIRFSKERGLVFVYSNRGKHSESAYSNIVTEGRQNLKWAQGSSVTVFTEQPLLPHNSGWNTLRFRAEQSMACLCGHLCTPQSCCSLSGHQPLWGCPEDPCRWRHRCPILSSSLASCQGALNSPTRLSPVTYQWKQVEQGGGR